MFDDIFQRPHPKHVKDLNLVPVIDMFTTVLFFLILSTSFYTYTKLTVPPAQVDTITKPLPKPPLAPRLLLASGKAGAKVQLVLTWEGSEPGEAEETIVSQDPKATPEEIRKKANSMLETFLKKNPDEKSIRLSMTPNTSYQYLISVMDGVRDRISDVVLTSYEEADAKFRGKQL
ncbi:MAG: ExbD/TolR family protein [Bdellovibrionia bacterium]